MQMCRVNHFVCPTAAVCVEECKHAARLNHYSAVISYSELSPLTSTASERLSDAKPVDERKD